MRPLAGALLLMASALSACSLSFGTVGTWSTETPPPTSLWATSSVVMTDGEVVFLGGFDSQTGQLLNRVLRFDPRSNSWSQGAPMPVQEDGYAIAPLSNGSVLVAGGGGTEGGRAPLATTWIYSLQLNSWRTVGKLNVARSGASAVLLTDGRVLIAGGSVPLATPIQLPNGSSDFFGFSNSAETFDPQTNSWSMVGSMHAARGSMAFLALPRGRALAAGGCAFANQGFQLGSALSSAELFDPATGAWTVTSPLPEPQCGAGGLLLRDGRALVTGGSVSGGSFSNAFLYDDKMHGWAAAGSTVQGGSAPILLADGRVFVAAVQAGQAQGRFVPLLVGGQVFDPASGDWTFATSDSVLESFQVGQEDPSPTLVAKSDGTAVVLLRVAGIALTFNASGSPPPSLILDSPGLALVLAAFAAALCLWLAIQYVRDRVRESARLRSARASKV